VWTNFYPSADGSAKWNGWIPIGNNTFPKVPVSTLSNGPGRSSLYLAGNDNRVWTNFYPSADGSAKWNGWIPISAIYSATKAAPTNGGCPAGQRFDSIENLCVPKGIISSPSEGPSDCNIIIFNECPGPPGSPPPTVPPGTPPPRGPPSPSPGQPRSTDKDVYCKAFGFSTQDCIKNWGGLACGNIVLPSQCSPDLSGGCKLLLFFGLLGNPGPVASIKCTQAPKPTSPFVPVSKCQVGGGFALLALCPKGPPGTAPPPKVPPGTAPSPPSTPKVSSPLSDWNTHCTSRDYYTDIGTPGKPVLHGAIDIPLPNGTPVLAPTDGSVSSQVNIDGRIYHTGVDPTGLGGNVIYFTSTDGSRMFDFAHLSQPKDGLPKPETPFKAGAQIATSGNTGASSTGPHLHFSYHTREYDPITNTWSNWIVKNPYEIVPNLPHCAP
jgi:hypothetical protein